MARAPPQHPNNPAPLPWPECPWPGPGTEPAARTRIPAARSPAGPGQPRPDLPCRSRRAAQESNKAPAELSALSKNGFTTNYLKTIFQGPDRTRRKPNKIQILKIVENNQSYLKQQRNSL